MLFSRFFGSSGACRNIGCFSAGEDPYATEDTLVDIICRPTTQPDGKVLNEDGSPIQVVSVVDQMRSLIQQGCVETPRDAGNITLSEEPQLIEEVMMGFIRTLLRGICVEVLLDDGSILLPEASLNYELTQLILDVSEEQALQRTAEGGHIQCRKIIDLKDIETVATPSDLAQMNILTSTQPHLDERCCTLIIKDCEFVTFRFDTERLCEYFTSCLKILVSAPTSRAGISTGGYTFRDNPPILDGSF